jgi:crotonobetainyl-CoA:carnitine CoA-transferase CaiB-like acyl-CoA transferase
MDCECSRRLAKTIIENYDNPLQGSMIDVPAHVESLLQSLGATTSDSGGKVTYYGSDPITRDRLPYGSISAISLAAKAILIAKIWKERTGEGQDIHVDVRKSLRRLTPFLDGKWELVNGFPGRTDPYSPVSGGPDIVPTRDGKWMMFAEIYPALRQRALDLLKPRGGSYEALRDAVKEWNGEELEQAGEQAGIPMPLARNIKDVLKMDAFTKNLGLMPLVSVEKVGESDPIPFMSNPTTPLDGIRLLSSSHVIAAPSIGRAMALHGAHALNVWRPSDVEHTLWHYTSHVGVRSTMLELGNKEGHAKFRELLSKADVLVTNRRAGWRDRFHIKPAEVIKERPGLIDTQITGPVKPGRGRIASASTSRPRSRWASTTLRVATRIQHIRRSTWPATTRRDGWQPAASCRHWCGVPRRAGATASGFRWYARHSGLPSWASSIATTPRRRPAQMMSTSTPTPMGSLSIRPWVAIPASRK